MGGLLGPEDQQRFLVDPICICILSHIYIYAFSGVDLLMVGSQALVLRVDVTT